jgi:hypothetical protein
MKDKQTNLIAPCGMNCALCLGYQREKNHCNGCRNEENIKYKTKHSTNCIIKNCENLKNTKSNFCYECDKYPCKRLKDLDKRYRTKYNMSMLENLEDIKEKGIKEFVKQQNIKWKCSQCNELLCVHREYCLNCEEKK